LPRRRENLIQPQVEKPNPRTQNRTQRRVIL